MDRLEDTDRVTWRLLVGPYLPACAGREAPRSQGCSKRRTQRVVEIFIRFSGVEALNHFSIINGQIRGHRQSDLEAPCGPLPPCLRREGGPKEPGLPEEENSNLKVEILILFSGI